MKIGRALEMQLILNDISVSRNHCQLKLEEDGNIIMEDNNSKFGSLILIQAEMVEILKGQTLTIQVGTNYLNIKLKKKTNMFGCCNVEEIDIKHSYEKINSKAIKYDKKNEILDESITPENSDNDEEKKNRDENDKNNIINIKKELNDKEDKSIKIKKEEKPKDNRNNKNNNLDSAYIGSTLFAKDNQKEENNIKKNEIKTNKKLNQKSDDEINSKSNKKGKNGKKPSIQSSNIIVSESDDNKIEESKNLINEDKEIVSNKE